MQTFAQMREENGPPLTSAKILDSLKTELALVEAEFERQASSNIQVINYLGEYLRSSGGKRIRPALLILSNYAVGGKGSDENVIRLATVMEMLHTATLVHDDIIDNADVRRGRSSINATFGNQTAVLMGDWLYMSAFETTVKERSLEIIDILTRLTRKMTEGELMQLTTIGRLDISRDEYFDILRRKTAFLFSACCEVGAILGGANDAHREAMRQYGMNLGIAFQIADDILDVTADVEQLGKAGGSDLLEGKLTLPLISLLEKEPDLRNVFKQTIQDGIYSQLSRNKLGERLTKHHIIADNQNQAKAFALSARKSIEVLPKTEYRSSLDSILDFAIARSS
jgi:octaprenyl-diphosphate synthase